jgi:histidinol-phosphatase
MGTLKDLEVAFDVADAAAALALTHFQAGVTSTPKSDGSPVTEVILPLSACFASRSTVRALRTLSSVRSKDR